MRQEMTLVTLGVADLDRSRRFYSEGLGWTPTLDMESVVFYQVGHGVLLSLFSLEELAADAGGPAGTGSTIALAQNLPEQQDVRDALERARGAGATVLKDAQPAFWGGYHGYFADPDGHRWEVAWNPGLVVEADGTVVFKEAGAP